MSLYFKTKGDYIYNSYNNSNTANKVFGFYVRSNKSTTITAAYQDADLSANSLSSTPIDCVEILPVNVVQNCSSTSDMRTQTLSFTNKTSYPRIVYVGYGGYFDFSGGTDTYWIKGSWKPFIIAPGVTAKFVTPPSFYTANYDPKCSINYYVYSIPLTIPCDYDTGTCIATNLSGPGSKYTINSYTSGYMPVFLGTIATRIYNLYVNYAYESNIRTGNNWSYISSQTEGLTHKNSELIRWSSCAYEVVWWENKMYNGSQCIFPFVFLSEYSPANILYRDWFSKDPNIYDKAWGNRYIQVRLPPTNATSYNRGAHNVGYIRYDNDGTVSLENQYANTDGSESFTNGNTIYVPVVTRPNSTFENNIISKAFICSEIGRI